MRKVLVASVAIVTLVLAGALVASPKITNDGYRASALDLDLLGLTQRARDLPEQSYPAH